MKPLSIVKVLPFFAPEFGGPVVQARSVCAALARRGHRVAVLTSDLGMPAGQTRDAWRDVDGYQVFTASVGRLGRTPPYRQATLRAPLRRLLADADVVAANVGLTWLHAMVVRECRAAGVPVVAGNNDGYACVMRDAGAISLVDPNDEAALAERIRLMLENDQVRGAWLDWAAESLPKYDFPHYVNDHLQVFRSVL